MNIKFIYVDIITWEKNVVYLGANIDITQLIGQFVHPLGGVRGGGGIVI